MNAIIGLCHFCEAHGPRPVFCTFTTDDESHTKDSSKSTVECTGCTSLGTETVLVTRDDDGTIFCSREAVLNADITAFLRQAAIRSITCEVSWSKEGGVVYFSETQGHVLSFMFQVKDTRARGLKRWFSIVVLMKDKMLLLNIMPVLSEHMKRISKELQQSAEEIYNNEQQICSQRALRLRTGRIDFIQSRSLKLLTGDDDVFKKLHKYFTWMLKAGALTYTETLHTSHDMLMKLEPKLVKNTIFDANVCEVPDEDKCLALRALEGMLSKSMFRIILYCMLTGIDIAIKSNIEEAATIKMGLKRLTPTNEECRNVRIIYEGETVPANICSVDKTSNSNYHCSWSGSLQTKSPTLMVRIENAMSNPKFNDAVLHQHVKSLLLEWLGIVRAVKSGIESSGPNSKSVIELKKVLGLPPQDDLILKYWISAFCS